MSSGTVLQRLTNMQNDLMSIEEQCNRENQIVWPLVAVLSDLEAAISEYEAKAYQGTPEPKPERGML